MKIYTTTLSAGQDDFSINEGDGVLQLSIQANSDSVCKITGGIEFQGNSASEIFLSNGQSLTLTANTSSPLWGVDITCISGTVNIVIAF